MNKATPDTLVRQIVLIFAALFFGTAIAAAQIPDLVVRSIRENPPRTPSQRLSAVQTMLNIGRGDLALEYLKPLAAAQLSDEQFEALNRRFGAAYFLRLMRESALDPVGDEFALAVLEGAARAARNPERVRELVEQLVRADENNAAILIDRLLPAGPAATAELLSQLARLESAERSARESLKTAIALGGSDSVPVLQAAIDSADESVALAGIEAAERLLADHPSLRFAVMSRFASTHQPEVGKSAAGLVTRFYGAAVDTNQVACWLAEETGRILDREMRTELNEEVWFWSTDDDRFISRAVPNHTAKYYRALRLASQLFNNHRRHPDAVALYAVSAAGLAKRQLGLDDRLTVDLNRILRGGAIRQAAFIEGAASDAELLGALAWALEHHTTAGAIGLIELLGLQKHSAAAILESAHGQPSPLVAALRHSNRRVRWAAAEAISSLDPQVPFKGACDLVGFYEHAVQSRGERVALIIDPNRGRAAKVAGNLNGLGYTALTVREGAEAMQAVLAETDLDLILISAQTYEPSFAELFQELRHDYRARRLPLAVLGDELNATQETGVDRYEYVFRFPYPTDYESAAVLVRRLESMADLDDLRADERLARAQLALARLRELSERTGDLAFFDLGAAAASTGAVSQSEEAQSEAIRFWSNLGTADAQRMLLQLSADQNQNPELRMQAARGLERSMHRFGINLRMSRLANLQDSIDDRQKSGSGVDDPTRLLLRILEKASLEQADG